MSCNLLIQGRDISRIVLWWEAINTFDSNGLFRGVRNCDTQRLCDFSPLLLLPLPPHSSLFPHPNTPFHILSLSTPNSLPYPSPPPFPSRLPQRLPFSFSLTPPTTLPSPHGSSPSVSHSSSWIGPSLLYRRSALPTVTSQRDSVTESEWSASLYGL